MYISAQPVTIDLGASNVYEEQSLGTSSANHSRQSQLEEREDQSRNMATLFPSNITTSGKTSFTATRQRLRSFAIHKQEASIDTAPTISPSHRQHTLAFVQEQVRGQSSHDLWLLILASFIIICIETPHSLDDPKTFSTFNIIFEVVSAYGTVGLSTGLPTADYSLSGGMRGGSKVVLCFIMLIGKHRGLPVALDTVVGLPEEQLCREEEDSRNHKARYQS